MFIPYKVDVAMERRPMANWVLIGLTVLVSVAMFKPLADWNDRGEGAASELQQMLSDAGIQLPEPEPTTVDYFLLQPGHFRVSQLVGNLFIHAGWLHLLGNMLFLFVFGNAVNAKLGNATYLLVYLGSGAIESVLWILVGPRAPCLGASGAIMGVVGAFAMLFPFNEVSIAYMIWLYYRGVFALSAIWVIGAYFLFDVLGLIVGGKSGVAYLSHVIGFIAGAAGVGAMLHYKFVEMDRNEKSLLQVLHWMPE